MRERERQKITEGLSGMNSFGRDELIPLTVRRRGPLDRSFHKGIVISSRDELRSVGWKHDDFCAPSGLLH